MSNATIQMTEEMIRRERIAFGPTKPQAISAIANRAKVSSGQIEGAIRGRVKDLKLGFVERITVLFITETTREIQRLTHELSIARLSGLSVDDGAVVAARAAMEKLQEAIGESAR